MKTDFPPVCRAPNEVSGRLANAKDRARVYSRRAFTADWGFDSGDKRGEPAEFALDRVIRRWTEACRPDRWARKPGSPTRRAPGP